MRALLGALVVAVCLAPVAAAVPAAGQSTQVTITVEVTDANGDPVGGANVTVSYGDTTKSEQTFSNGKVFFDVAEGADVTVSAATPDLALNHPETVPAVDGDTEISLVMHPESTAEITVQTPDGTPVEDARVTLEKTEEVLALGTKSTAANGTVVLSDIEAGDYQVEVTRPGYYSTTTTMVVSNRAGKTITLEPGSVAVNFETLDGHYDDRALSANVVLYSDGEFVSNISTGSSGARTVSLDVNTEYRVVVKRNGYERKEFEFVTGESDASRTVSLTRTPTLSIEPANSQVVTGQSVRVTVTDEYGERVAGASIQVGGETVGETDSDGTTQVTIETAGDVEITAVSGSLEASVVVQGVEPSTDRPTTAMPTTSDPTTAMPTTSDPTTAMPTTSDPTETAASDGPIPGFGGVVAVLALAVSLLALARRANH